MSKFTKKDFDRMFDTEKKCIDYIMKIKTLEQKTCAKCSKEFKYFMAKENRFSCECGNRLSPKKGTIFEDSTTPLNYWFYVIFLFSTSKNGVSAKFVERQIGVTYKTAWRICNKIRTIMKEYNIKPIDNSIVEIDETYIGGKEKNKHWNKKNKNSQGRSTSSKTPIIGMVNRDNGTVRAIVTKDVQKSTMMNFLEFNLTPNNILMTDEFNIYNNLSENYCSHYKVEHYKKEYAKGKIYTNSIEGFWSIFKRGLRTYIHVDEKYLQNYLDEFIFRYNNRKEENIFNIILNNI